MERTKRQIKKIATAIVGGLVLLVGIIAIPYPGPGWLIVFAGLGILATEFEWARRLLGFARQKYDKWTTWLKRQSIAVRIIVIGLTTIIVLLTIWLLNVLGLVNNMLNLNMPWLYSPLGIFK